MRSASPVRIADPDACVETVLTRVGRRLVVGLPVGIGYPNRWGGPHGPAIYRLAGGLTVRSEYQAMNTTAHVDTFVRDHLPPVSQWPEFLFELPELRYPPLLNCAVELLDRHAALRPHALAIRTAEGDWSYGRLKDLVDRLCAVLACDMRVEPGNRVLLRAGNSVMLYAAWLAVARVGAVVVATMPLLRRRELATIVDKARIRHALCEVRLAAELGGLEGPDGRLRTLTWGDGELESRLATQPTGTAAVETAQDDPCLLAFTSGTTGQPKATVHFHRDVLAMADTFAAHLLSPRPDDVFTGTPPLAFTYGLGAELVFPLRFGSATAVMTGPTPDHLREGIARFGATRVFTAPTAYRALLAQAATQEFRSVRSFVSAGEHLPQPTFDAWHLIGRFPRAGDPASAPSSPP